jgi:hypothetical protein
MMNPSKKLVKVMKPPIAVHMVFKSLRSSAATELKHAANSNGNRRSIMDSVWGRIVSGWQ